jgi:hypothetical protein
MTKILCAETRCSHNKFMMCQQRVVNFIDGHCKQGRVATSSSAVYNVSTKGT